MFQRTMLLVAALLAIGLVATSRAHDLTEGMKKGTPEIQSAGPATFAPHGILLLGDTKGANLFAIATDDKASGSPQAVNIDKIDEKIASLLGVVPQQVKIADLAVNPETGNIFLTVARGAGPDAALVVIRIDAAGKMTQFALKDVLFSQAPIPNAPGESNARNRQQVTTDLQFANGQVIVAGLSNEEFASTLRVIPFPFADVNKGAGVEIWHASHGRFETASPVRTLAVFNIGDETNVLAAYTCTPLVKFPVSDLKPGTKVKGTTIAELGNRNQPLDMIVYQKDGKDFLLMSNSSRGVMKVSLADVAKSDGITNHVSDKAGLPYDTIADWKGVEQLDRLDKDRAVLLVKTDAGTDLRTVQLP